jgi:hypothetical protein
MKSLSDYSKLTIRVSQAMIVRRNNGDGHGYRYFISCDEMPGCCGHGPTISQALKNFHIMAELWLTWFGNLYPQGRKV